MFCFSFIYLFPSQTLLLNILNLFVKFFTKIVCIYKKIVIYPFKIISNNSFKYLKYANYYFFIQINL